MDIESVRHYCLSFPHVTENVQWGNDLVFKIGGKMFAITVLEGAAKYCLSFKCTPEEYGELTERDGIDRRLTLPVITGWLCRALQ